MRIKRLDFKAGKEVDDAEGLTVEPTSVSIIIGPNNSGKSQCIREIYRWLRGDVVDFKVLQELEMEYPPFNQLMKTIRGYEVQPTSESEKRRCASGEFILSRPEIPGVQRERRYAHPSRIATVFEERGKDEERRELHSNTVYLLTLLLDGATRLRLVEETDSAPVNGAPENHLIYLYTNESARKIVSSYCQEAFDGLHFTIDPSQMRRLRTRLSPQDPDAAGGKPLTDPMSEYHRTGQLVTEMGDGVKSFTGIIAAVVALRQKFILLDDPEAFLHPPVARILGNSLSTLSHNQESQMFISTHSGNFLYGVLEKAQENQQKCTIIRLTYDTQENATATLLDSETLLAFMTKPILRSSSVLDGLFHSAVVVTEGDSDRVVYQEINRILLERGEKGVRDAAFIRAQHRDTVYKIVGPLKKVGVPTACILDMDLFFDPDEEATHEMKHLESLLESTEVPPDRRSKILEKCKRIRPELHTLVTREVFKREGLRNTDLQKADISSRLRDVMNQLEEYGIFVVGVGQLESWLEHLNIEGKSSRWVVNLLERLGCEPRVEPTDDDVWEFLREIAWYLQP